ncbi:MAG: leucine-rich repeat protein [Bacteroidaceae bacterium]|nr:leucine-rich repeat protein [Bacteroidaceae bacterium]
MKRHILTFIALTLALTRVQADGISVTNVTIEPGQTATVAISLDNTATNLVSFQMDLTLPEGVTINKNDCSLSNRFTDEDQELTIGKQGDNVYRLTSTSFALTPISGTSGEIITLSLSASESATGGTASLSNIRFVTSNSEKLTLDDVSFSLSVASPSPNITFTDANVKALCVENWDSNEDGELSEAEAASVTDLGEVFKNNTEITSFDELQYFTGLTSIGDGAFDGCEGLTSIILPNSLTSIGEEALRGTGITSITIPASVNSLNNNTAFEDCASLTEINVEEGNSFYYSVGGVVFSENEEWYGQGGKGIVMFPAGRSGSYEIPSGVTSIDLNSFASCNKMTSITIPASVKRVMTGAFSGCTSLSKVIVSDIAAWCGITYDGDDYNGDFPLGRAFHLYSDENTEITEVVIPDGVERIEARAFRDAKYITSVTIPSSVTYIGPEAFRGMHSLSSVNIPQGITSIESLTFNNCISLVTVTIPTSVTNIGSFAFMECFNLTSIIIPENVTKIEENAFTGCNVLSSLTLNDNLIEIGTRAFQNTNLKDLVIPNSVTTIGNWAFENYNDNPSLETVVLGESVASIGIGAFQYQSNLTKVVSLATTPPTLVTPGNYAFTNRADAILYVPAGSKETYQAADYWKEFKEIREEGDEVHLMGQSWEARYQFFENWEEVTDPTDGTDNPWYSPDFDDSGWPTLTGPLDNNNWDAEFSAYYLRQIFTLDEVKEGYYSLTVRHDDFVSVYLNGTLVGAKDGGTHEFVIPSSLLVVGNNLLAFYIDDRGGVERALDYEFFYMGNNNTGIYIDEQGVVYKRDENGYYVHRTLYNFDATSVVIPEELFDLPVTRIGHSAFTSGCGNLQSITIPESVTSIEDWAFEGCGSLTSVTIPASVISIGVGAFCGCNLTMVTVESDTPTSINNEVTFSNRGNAILFVPVGSKAAYEAADYWKDFKAILEVGEDPTILQYGADQAWSMKYVFNESCENVQEPANDSNDNPWYAEAYNDEAWEALTGPMAREGDTFDQVNYTWETPGSCYFLRRTFQMESIKDGFYELWGICDDNMDAYVNGQKLVKENRGENFHWLFRIPSTLLHEGNNTLALFIMDNGGGDAYLDYSMSFAETPKTIAFADADVKAICVANWDTNGDGELSTLEAASVGDLSDCFMNNEESVLETFDSFDELQYFTGLPSLNPWVFYNCTNLKSVTIPNSVTSIENFAFQGCSSLTSITIPSSVTSIGDHVFEGCSSLTSVSMPDNVITFTGYYAFGEDNNIESVYIADLAAWLGTAFTYGNNPLRSGAKLYLNNEEVKDLVIPEGTTSILTAAFEGCESITSVVLPNSLTDIEGFAFYGCSSLTSITIPSSVTSIGDNAFFGCVNLESVSIPNSVTSISSSAFRKCWLLTSFTFNSAEEALTKVDDVYQIGTAEDLHNFAILTTAASSSLNACLTADIDYTGYTGSCNGGSFYPIGVNGYKGTFDGQGHTITLNIEDSHYSDQVDGAGNAMFLLLTEGGVIRNLRTSGTIESSCRFSAGILSYLADGTVSHCVSDVDIISNIEGDCTDGGIVALGNMSGDSPGLVEYCVFAGSFQGESATHRGGIVGVGYSGNSSNITLDNCLFIAATDNLSVDGSDTFIREPNESTTISNCYYLNTLGDASAGTQTTSEQLTSGELCYLLNGESSDNPIWTQTLGEDSYPVPFNTHGIVYAQDGGYTNTPESQPEIEVTDISQLDNAIYIEPVEAFCGDQKVLSIKMKNNVAIQTIQFDLYLPEGLTVVANEDNELMTASKERINKFNYFISSIQADGALRLLAQATTTNVPAGDGEICTITVNVSEDMEEGDYPLVFKGIRMTEQNNTNHAPDPNIVQTKLTISSYILGDANGDRDVDAIDFNMIANDILGYSQSNFNRKAADINGDGDVDAIDFNMIANKILYGSFSGIQNSMEPM